MGSIRIAPFALALALAIAPPIPGNSTTFVDRPFQDSVQDAPVIVRGKVGMSYSDWGHLEDGARRLFTFYELQLEEVLKGPVQGQTLYMRELGGEKDGVGMQVSGAARFSRGEEVVVFLSDRNSEGSYDVRGMMMGRFGLEKDASGDDVLTGPGLGSSTQDDSGIIDDEQPQRGQTGPGKSRRGGAHWTLTRLRQLIDAQKSIAPGARSHGNFSQKHALAPSVRSSTGPDRASGSPAPQLQNSSVASSEASAEAGPGEGSNASSGSQSLWIAIGLGGLLLLAGWRISRKR